MEKISRLLPMIKSRFGIYTFGISPRLSQNEILLVAVEAKKDQDVLKLRFPAYTKVGPPESIRMLVNIQSPGYKVRPVNCSEYQIKPSNNTCFYLENNGDLPELNELDGVSLHMGADFDILSITVFAVEIE